MFSWERVVEYFPQILQKFPVTLEIVLVSFTAGILLGTILAMVRIKKIPVLSQIATVYISYVRCTPVICQMFVIYFGIPALVSSLGGDTAGIDNIVYVLIAYGINMGGFMGETIRAAILAVPSAQSEAGWTVGLTRIPRLWCISLRRRLCEWRFLCWEIRLSACFKPLLWRIWWACWIWWEKLVPLAPCPAIRWRATSVVRRCLR